MKKEPIMNSDSNTPEIIGEAESVVKPLPQFGLIIGTLIVFLILIFAGLYVWGQMLTDTPEAITPTPKRPTAAENNEPESTTAEAKTEILNIVSTSDELSAIEADLEATAIDEIEPELGTIDASLDTPTQSP